MEIFSQNQNPKIRDSTAKGLCRLYIPGNPGCIQESLSLRKPKTKHISIVTEFLNASCAISDDSKCSGLNKMPICCHDSHGLTL